MYISLSSSYAGNACAIRQSINNYTKNSNETQFFDWLVTSMKSVNQILENTPITFESNYIYPNPLKTTSINFKNFDLLISHHDIHEFNDNSINEITEKYLLSSKMGFYKNIAELLDQLSKERSEFIQTGCNFSKMESIIINS